jgi:processive 1,2-diacylglycerol beta-glucosyltransferase
MDPEKTQVGGFLLQRSFFDSVPHETDCGRYVAEQLQLNPDEFILLLSASGHGANNHLRFLEALNRNGAATQTVVLCGQSAEAQRRVECWVQDNRARHVRVLPHDADVGRLMRCASAVVTRPGTGTTSEAILSGCPLLLNCLGGLMPQEMITVKYCRKHGLSEVVRRPQDLLRLVKQWAGNPDTLHAIRQRMKAARPAGHPLRILQSVADVATAPFTTDSSVAAPIPVVEAARAGLQTVPASLEMLRPR